MSLNLRKLNHTELCVTDLQGLLMLRGENIQIHLILRLPDSMLRFVPASSFNTGR